MSTQKRRVYSQSISLKVSVHVQILVGQVSSNQFDTPASNQFEVLVNQFEVSSNQFEVVHSNTLLLVVKISRDKTMNEEAALGAVSAILLGYGDQEEKTNGRRRKRRVWVKPWIQRRDTLGAYNALISDISLSDREDYCRFMRMNTEAFSELLERVRPYITKQTTVMRKPISAEENLAITLRFLATGESYESLSFLFRVHYSTIANFVPKVCHYIYEVLKSEYLKIPSTENEWKVLAEGNFRAWNFPNAIAAVDGKHVAIIKPDNAFVLFI